MVLSEALRAGLNKIKVLLSQGTFLVHLAPHSALYLMVDAPTVVAGTISHNGEGCNRQPLSSFTKSFTATEKTS